MTTAQAHPGPGSTILQEKQSQCWGGAPGFLWTKATGKAASQGIVRVKRGRWVGDGRDTGRSGPGVVGRDTQGAEKSMANQVPPAVSIIRWEDCGRKHVLCPSVQGLKDAKAEAALSLCSGSGHRVGLMGNFHSLRPPAPAVSCSLPCPLLPLDHKPWSPPVLQAW